MKHERELLNMAMSMLDAPKPHSTFPKYNVYRELDGSPYTYFMEFALAGYPKDALDVKMDSDHLVVSSRTDSDKKEESPNTASIVPIAFPMIAGAGTMTSLVSLRAEFATINIIIAIVLNMIVVYAVLKNTERIERIMGSGGLSILRKVFGVILLAIAVKLFFANL